MNLLSIPGPAGNIEATLDLVKGSSSGAVVCHPHPLYGGTMHDAVVGALSNGFTAGGVSSLRFNFRGVGKSSGSHDRGEGEAEDLAAVCDWFRDQHGLDSLYVAGYSFGAGITLRVAPKVNCQGVVLVAPPLQMVGQQAPVELRMLVVLGDEDPIVDCDALQEHFSRYPEVGIKVMAGADHFFVTAGGDITAAVTEFVSGT